MFKSISKICLMLPLVFAMGACQELEQDVLDGVTAEDIAKSTNPNLINVLKASAYARIVGSWGGHNSIWSIQEVSSDEMVLTGKMVVSGYVCTDTLGMLLKSLSTTLGHIATLQ
jgi:hypothetical protein